MVVRALSSKTPIMKKPFVIIMAIAAINLAACQAHNTEGHTVDSSASHGYNGGISATDTINGSAAPFAQSTSGTDTSTDGHDVDDPVVDTGHSQHKKHK